MANSLSTIMTNILADPIELNRAVEDHGRGRVKVCRVATAAAQLVNHIFVLGRFKANDVITSIRWNNDLADAGMADVNIGGYVAGDWSAADQSAVDDNALADAVDMSGAAALFAECLGSGLTTTGDLVTKRLWEALAVAAEPAAGTEYDIGMTTVTAGGPAATSNYTVIIEYLAGD